MDASIGTRHNRNVLSLLARPGLWILAACILTACGAERKPVTAPADASRILIAANNHIGAAIEMRNAIVSEMQIDSETDLIQTEGRVVYQEDITDALKADKGPKKRSDKKTFITVVCTVSHGGILGEDGVTFMGPYFPGWNDPNDKYLSVEEVREAMKDHPSIELVFMAGCDSGWESSANDFRAAFHAKALIGLIPTTFVGGAAQDGMGTGEIAVRTFGPAVVEYCRQRRRFLRGEKEEIDPLVQQGRFGRFVHEQMIVKWGGVLKEEDRRKILVIYE